MERIIQIQTSEVKEERKKKSLELSHVRPIYVHPHWVFFKPCLDLLPGSMVGLTVLDSIPSLFQQELGYHWSSRIDSPCEHTIYKFIDTATSSRFISMLST